MVGLNYVEIGQRIKYRRKELLLTQKELGVKVGLSEGSVSKYEAGKVEDATTTKLNEFATVLGVSISWLLGINGHKEEEKTNQKEDILTQAAHMVGHEGPLTDEEKDKITLAIKIALAKHNK
ncbi:MAG TPA: helix-turn-helix transcriptional regulator [Clostridia bacterium]|nr:helix-turn-helix transcriptional regulator [Clostridia bacterium]